jgi:C1A family cysteine protease
MSVEEKVMAREKMERETVDRPSSSHHPAEDKHPAHDNYNPHITPKCRGLGWRRDKLDKRDHLFTYQVPDKVAVKIPSRKVLPELPIWDQGQLGSCTANGVNFIIQYDLICRRKKPKLKETDILSRLMTYYGERWLEGSINDDAGAEVRDGIKFMAKYGACLEDGPNSWPYDILKFKQKPPDPCWEIAKHYQALRYRPVPQNTQALRGCIAEGYPIVFGFECYSGLDSDQAEETGYIPMPKQGEDPIGGHCIAIVGYDDATRRFKIRNSWSEEWGDKGYGYMDYEYVIDPTKSSDFWTVRTVG